MFSQLSKAYQTMQHDGKLMTTQRPVLHTLLVRFESVFLIVLSLYLLFGYFYGKLHLIVLKFIVNKTHAK